MADAFDYLATRADADELIAEFGQAGAIRRVGATSTVNPWDPEASASVDHPCLLVDLEYSAGEANGTLIRQTDRKILMSVSTLTIEPTEADQVVVGGHAMEIVNVSPLAPGGVVILYEIQARG